MKIPNVFISHSSQDKGFVHRLVTILSAFAMNIWYDDWEIAVGDSIVEKVFEGLSASDSLVIVLSKASVMSRWVREELNVTVMRRLSEQDIRILPILIDDCNIPIPLKHIKYADFRTDEQAALTLLLDSITPSHRLQESLNGLYDRFCSLSDAIVDKIAQDSGIACLVELHSLLESALGLRFEIEFRKLPNEVRPLTFFQKIEALHDKGIDVRSQTWNAFVSFRAAVAHDTNMHTNLIGVLIQNLPMKRNAAKEDADSDLNRLKEAMGRLKTIMHTLCFKSDDVLDNLR